MQALLRYPGAKWSIAKELINYFPEHKGYLEPYFGSGAILFNKFKSRLETINDIDKEVINFFKVLRDDDYYLTNLLMYTPYSKDIYLWARDMIPKNDGERAYKFFIMSWMSHGGYQPYKTSWSHSKNPDGPNKAVLFKNAIENLKDFADRLKTVQIENTNALELIKAHDFKDTLIYLDPPYLLSTRKNNLYKNELSDTEHIDLLNTAVNMQNAKILISGYDNLIYDDLLKSWHKHYIKSLDGVGNIKQEVIWFNYDLPVQESLF